MTAEIFGMDMEKHMRDDAIEAARKGIEMGCDDAALAEFIRQIFDEKYDKYWQTIVSSTSFACSLHLQKEVSSYIDFQMEGRTIMLFRMDYAKRSEELEQKAEKAVESLNLVLSHFVTKKIPLHERPGMSKRINYE